MSGGATRWYKDGLRFACTGCGRCCTGGDGYVWVSRQEIARLAERLDVGLDDFGRRYLRRVDSRHALLDGNGGDCIFLVGKACSVYEDRPVQCRAYPWWPANLASPEAWTRAAGHCEGISDSAPRVGADVIEPLLVAARKAGLAPE